MLIRRMGVAGLVLLGLLAMGGLMASSASAHLKLACYEVSKFEAGRSAGNWSNSTCTTEVTRLTGKFVLAEPILVVEPASSGSVTVLWCAKLTPYEKGKNSQTGSWETLNCSKGARPREEDPPFVEVNITRKRRETCGTILGAGSSLQNVAQEKVWIQGFTRENEFLDEPGTNEGSCTTAPTINYLSTSSGRGKEQWGYKCGALLLIAGTFPAYIGTDVAPTKAQIECMDELGQEGKAKEGVMAVPVAQSAVTIMMALPELCDPVSFLTAPEVKQPQLTKLWETGSVLWDELLKDALTALDERGKACLAEPKLFARSSSSGTTAGFKGYFWQNEEGRKEGTWLRFGGELPRGEEPVWPNETIVTKCCEKGSQLASTVMEEPGALGYADLADAKNTKFLLTGTTTTVLEYSTVWKTVLGTLGKEPYWVAIGKVETTKNSAGERSIEFTPPETKATVLVNDKSTSVEASNCEKATYKGQTGRRVAPNVDWSEAKQTNVLENRVYPICTLTFDLAWHNYGTRELVKQYGAAPKPEETAASVYNYLKWLVFGEGGAEGTEQYSEGGQNSALEFNHYGILPKEIRKAAQEGVTSTNIVG